MNSEEECAAATVVYTIAKRKNNVTNVESGEINLVVIIHFFYFYALMHELCTEEIVEYKKFL